MKNTFVVLTFLNLLLGGCEKEENKRDIIHLESGLEYPMALFLKENRLYFTETSQWGTSFGGILSLDSYDLSSNKMTVLKENPENYGALVVVDNEIFLGSVNNGRLSIFDLHTNTESHFMWIEADESIEMCLDDDNNIFLLGVKRSPETLGLYKFPRSNYTQTEVLLEEPGRGWSITYSNGYIYYADLDFIYQYNQVDEPVVFREKHAVLGMSCSENYLYYSSLSGELGRVNLNTKENEILYESINRPGDLVYDKQRNALYFLSQGTEDELFKNGELLVINNIE